MTIDVTKKHKGRRVVYAADRPHLAEAGVIDDCDLHMVHVRFDRDGKVKHVRREALSWEGKAK